MFDLPTVNSYCDYCCNKGGLVKNFEQFAVDKTRVSLSGTEYFRRRCSQQRSNADAETVLTCHPEEIASQVCSILRSTSAVFLG